MMGLGDDVDEEGVNGEAVGRTVVSLIADGAIVSCNSSIGVAGTDAVLPELAMVDCFDCFFEEFLAISVLLYSFGSLFLFPKFQVLC